MTFRLYNTLSRNKEDFKSLTDKFVGIYTCGPTVYNYAHIGNLRSYVFSDLLKRYLLWKKFKVKHVMNITDVGHLISDENTGEDKVEKEARIEGKPAREIAEFYTKAFLKDIEQLNILPADIMPKATEHIDKQINFIKKLEEKGFTYKTSDGIYFDTSKLPDYGKLARLDVKGLRPGIRIDIKEKKNPTDFVLWKLSPKDKKRQMEWESPWGVGFPGWHIECSEMSMEYLGEQFDIHTGGIDHIPVHHTNEIAQSEALLGHPFVNYWMHNEFLIIGGSKMAKSKENFFTLSDLTIQPLAYRLFLLSTHYREKIHLSDEGLVAAEMTYSNLRSDLERLSKVTVHDGHRNRVKPMLVIAKKEFIEAMDNDLSAPTALDSLFRLLNTVKKLTNLTKDEASQVVEYAKDIDRVFGLKLSGSTEIPVDIETLVSEREKARMAKDFVKSDVLRSQIEKKGYVVEDTFEGPIVLKK